MQFNLRKLPFVISNKGQDFNVITNGLCYWDNVSVDDICMMSEQYNIPLFHYVYDGKNMLLLNYNNMWFVAKEEVVKEEE